MATDRDAEPGSPTARRNGRAETRSVRGESPSQLMRRYGLRAKRSWGQNFLHDPRIAARIVDLAQPRAGDTVVEIGAGLGALTDLLAARCARLVAIERDRELVEVLRERFGGCSNVEIAATNALRFDYAQFSPPALVVGNLPYHISSQLLFALVDQRAGVREAVVMLQRELADRLAAGPGSRTYGAPSVLLQQLADIEVCLQVGRGAFTPAPKVDSTVLRLRMRAQPRHPTDEQTFRRLVRAAFGNRRKTLPRALSPVFSRERVVASLQQLGLSPLVRAEQLDIAAFAELASELAEDARRERDPQIAGPQR